MKEEGIIGYWNGFNKVCIKYPEHKITTENAEKMFWFAKFWIKIHFRIKVRHWVNNIEEKYKTKVIKHSVRYKGLFSQVSIIIRLSSLTDPSSLSAKERKIFFTNVKKYSNRCFIRYNPLPIL